VFGLREEREMNRRGSDNNPGGPRRFQTAACASAREWLNKETKRIDNMAMVGDASKVSRQHAAFVTVLSRLLEEHDKLLKYGLIVVKCHEKQNFSENVAALRSYLVEDLKVEL
jgi:hypothetical protein